VIRRALLTLFLAALVCAVEAAPIYRMVDIGVLPGGDDLSFSAAINEAGQVVGNSATGTGRRAFFWDELNGLQNLGALPGHHSSRATDLNNLGQVVGVSTGPGNAEGDQQAFIWDSVSGIRSLGQIPGGAWSSIAEGINDAGEVVGVTDLPAPRRAFTWDESTGMMELVPSSAWAEDVNESGDRVGFFQAPDGRRAFLVDSSGAFVNLGLLPGDFGSQANAVNDQGIAAGVSFALAGPQTPVIWVPGEGIVDLRFGVNAVAFGINNSNEVVGATSDAALYWGADRTPYNLNDLIDLTDPLRGFFLLTSALDINDSGQIAATGRSRLDGSFHAFRLDVVGAGDVDPADPIDFSVPEPHTLALVGLGLLGIGLRQHLRDVSAAASGRSGPPRRARHPGRRTGSSAPTPQARAPLAPPGRG